jgi:hypothetical protein
MDWSDAELDLIVADYFAMLQSEQAGVPYVKSHHRAQLMTKIGRTNRSIEFKHMNISAVLEEMGRPTIKGYKAKEHYQRSILQAIERYMPHEPDLWIPPQASGFAEPRVPFLEGPPALGPPKVRPPELVRLVQKFDQAERDFRNRSLGKVGEESVFHFERQRLQAEGRPDLAQKVRWISQEDGDGAGYDIHSYEASGSDRLVEVKTTLGHARTPFYLSRNEHDLAGERPDAFKLVRLHSFNRDPRMFELKPPLTDFVRLSAHIFEARFN